MRYRIERVRYKDGDKSPFWEITVYKNGIAFDESPQYSSLWFTIMEWLRVTILY